MTEHYLKSELYGLWKQNDLIIDFLQEGFLDGIWFWDLKQPDHIWISPGFWRLLGFDPAAKQHLAMEWKLVINGDDRDVLEENLRRHLQEKTFSLDLIVRFTHNDDSTVWVRMKGFTFRDEQENAQRLLIAHNDLTPVMREQLRFEENKELRKLNENLREMADRDFLTHLFNRRMFEDRFHYLVSLSIRNHAPLSLAIFDLDHFKWINDRYGHLKGDEVLRGFAKLLDDIRREADIVARTGGEEFCMLFPDSDEQEGLTAVERILDVVRSEPVADLAITVSCGVTTVYPQNGDTAALLLTLMMKQADQALYSVKEAGRDHALHYAEISSK